MDGRSDGCSCCECGALVGIEGPQRGGLLMPCQHILHMGCAEFIRRRGKLLKGIDTADLPNETEAAEEVGRPGSSNAFGNISSLRYERESDLWVCPSCLVPITRIIPLFFQSVDDGAQDDSAVANPLPAAVSTAKSLEAAYKQVHTTQKLLLRSLRDLYSHRRRVTELMHSCANLHERRARCLADVKEEERCFPSPVPADGSYTKNEELVGSSTSIAVPHGALLLDQMGMTELELYMAQVTPQLLLLQADLRKEQRLRERRTRKLNALRAHYHSTKELRAIDDQIAQREARLQACADADDSLQRPVTTSHAPGNIATSRSNPLQPLGIAHSHCSDTASFTTPHLGRKRRRRCDTAIDVDDEVAHEVMEVLSEGVNDSERGASPAANVAVLDVDESSITMGSDGDSRERVEILPLYGEDEYRNESALDTPYLIPCYVRPAADNTAFSYTSSTSPTTPKVPIHSAVTRHHLQLLPRREDRLWQSSLKF